MELRGVVWALLLVGAPTLYAGAKTPFNSALDSAYDHFVGVWRGTDDYNASRGTVTVSVTLTITEARNRRSLKLDYIYGQKGAKDYDHVRREMVLDPEAGLVTLRWEDDHKEKYKATGLDEFVRAGYGSFEFSDIQRGNGDGGTMTCILSLAQNELKYQWRNSINEAGPRVTGTWSLVRSQTAAPAN